MADKLRVLYYPYASIHSLNFLGRALLAFDKIYLIVPSAYYGRMNVALRPTSGSLNGSFYETHYHLDPLLRAGVVETMDPYRTVSEYRDLMLAAHEDDLHDPAMSQFGTRGEWVLYKEKVPEPILDSPEFSRYDKGRTMELPFLTGESIMISHAIFSCFDRPELELQPMTDDLVHESFLKVRLNRGLQLLKGKEYSRYLADGFTYVSRALKLGLPALRPEGIGSLVAKLIEARREDNRDLRELRQALREIVILLKTPDTSDIVARLAAGQRRVQAAFDDFMEGKARPPPGMPPYVPGLAGQPIGFFAGSVPPLATGLVTSRPTSVGEEAITREDALRCHDVALRLSIS